MTTSLKIIKVGNSFGLILPKEVLAKLDVVAGDKLSVTETKYGIQLKPYNEEYEKQMEIARRVMNEDREVLKKLAE